MPSGREVRKGSDKGKRDLLVVVPVFLLGKLVLGDFLCLALPEESDNKHVSMLRFLRLPTSHSLESPCYIVNLYNNEELSLDYFSKGKP